MHRSPRKNRDDIGSRNEPPISNERTLSQAISRHTTTDDIGYQISDPRFQRHDSITMLSQSPRQQVRSAYSCTAGCDQLDSKHTTLSPGFAVSRQTGTISDLESASSDSLTRLYHRALRVSRQAGTISDLKSAILRFQKTRTIIISSRLQTNRDDIGYGISDYLIQDTTLLPKSDSP
ncbi:hypothetical protein AVEN_215090-1 [Araneus ventricosus]|uniref:Uncharacterized protein n=1 Tax=Araneus ventricosus TaxID=182803 RepID=A0A4Y2X419_ARAVE|nr:hypothetical protein AVEN_215090-1 [Araneus ventricosus]